MTLLLLAGCGNKGPLYLEFDEASPVLQQLQQSLENFGNDFDVDQALDELEAEEASRPGTPSAD